MLNFSRSISCSIQNNHGDFNAPKITPVHGTQACCGETGMEYISDFWLCSDSPFVGAGSWLSEVIAGFTLGATISFFLAGIIAQRKLRTFCLKPSRGVICILMAGDKCTFTHRCKTWLGWGVQGIVRGCPGPPKFLGSRFLNTPWPHLYR